VKILVPLERVPDLDRADRLAVTATGDELDLSALERQTNPFDLHALEAALRLTEDGRAPRQRLGEVVVVTLGPEDADVSLRNALGLGADRAVRVTAAEAALDGRLVAKALARLVGEERPDLVLLGKQAVDGDGCQVGQRLGALLDWPVASFAIGLEQTDDGLIAALQVDGGVRRLRLRLPAVVTVDLAIVGPAAVRSLATGHGFEYGEGVRFASLLSTRQAQRKPLAVRRLDELVDSLALGVRRVGAGVAPGRRRGRRVESVEELVACLADEARVLR